MNTMKYYFILNPAAGQGRASELTDDIRALCEVSGIDCEIHETTAVGEAETFVRGVCKAYAQEQGGQLRFYACGGDGTLSEVVNGMMGFAFAEAGCIPTGTGNDFVRNFPEADFTDLAAQIRGSSGLCDLIHYEGICDGRPVSRYCVNMFNIGFDCNVVDMTDRMKRLPLMTGPVAYLASVAAMLIGKKGADLSVAYDDGYIYDGRLLLISIANGSFCGGGIKGLPRAVTSDGVMDVSLVRNVSRLTFVTLFPKYMKGTHLEEPRLASVIRYTHEQSLTISPNRGTMKFCVDGEITKAGEIRFRICPDAFRFVVPARKEY